MTDSPKADKWMGDYRFDDGQSLRDVFNRQWRDPRPFAAVIRHNFIDYAFAPGYFRFIANPDDYHFGRSCGWWSQPHGTADSCYLNLLEYIQRECARFPGASIDQIVNPVPTPAGVPVWKALTQRFQVEDEEPCPICEAERAEAARA